MLLSGWCMKRTQQHRYNRGRGTPVPHRFLPIPLTNSLILSFPPNWHLCLAVIISLFPHFLISPCLLSFVSSSSSTVSLPLLQFPLSNPYYNNSVEDSWLLISLSSQMSHLCSDLNMCGYSVGAELLYLSDYINEALQYTKDTSRQKDQKLTCTKPCDNSFHWLGPVS